MKRKDIEAISSLKRLNVNNEGFLVSNHKAYCARVGLNGPRVRAAFTGRGLRLREPDTVS